MSLESRLGLFITRLGAELKAKAPTSRLISAGTGLTGGGSLAADRTLAVAYGTAASTAAQGDDSRIAYTAPVAPTLNAAKFASFSTSGTPGYQSLKVWKQGRTGFMSGMIKNTVDLGFGAHVVVAAGGVAAALRPVSAWPGGNVPSTTSVADRVPRLDMFADGSIQVAVGLYTVTAGSAWAINMHWPLD